MCVHFVGVDDNANKSPPPCSARRKKQSSLPAQLSSQASIARLTTKLKNIVPFLQAFPMTLPTPAPLCSVELWQHLGVSLDVRMLLSPEAVADSLLRTIVAEKLVSHARERRQEFARANQGELNSSFDSTKCEN